MPDQFGVDSPAIQAIARTLRTSTTSLEDAAAQSAHSADAGESTPAVSDAIASLLRASAAMVEGAARSGEDVAASDTTYNNTDDTAREGLPPVPLPPNNPDTSSPMPWGNQ